MSAPRHRIPVQEPSLRVKTIRRLRRKLRAVQMRSWARSRLRRKDAVILDTETTDLFGHVVQVSVIDLAGQVLLSTLVRPNAKISPAATAVHGICDQDLQDAPSLEAVAAQLLEATRDRQLLAYNAPYDRQVLAAGLRARDVYPNDPNVERYTVTFNKGAELGDHMINDGSTLHIDDGDGFAAGATGTEPTGPSVAGRIGLRAVDVDPAHLADPQNWVCLMRARSVVEGRGWTALGGPHHALGDCLATLEVLHGIAGRPT